MQGDVGVEWRERLSPCQLLALQLKSSWTRCFSQLPALIPSLATGSYTGMGVTL